MPGSNQHDDEKQESLPAQQEGEESQGLKEIGRDVREAGDKTREVRKFYEKSTGISVVSSQNAKDFKQVKGGTMQQQALPPPKKPEQPTLFDEPSGEEGQ